MRTFDLDIVKPGEPRDDHQVPQAAAPTPAVARQPKDTQPTGRAPTDIGNVAEPVTGSKPRTEVNVALSRAPKPATSTITCLMVASL
jgi:hypothetical protein